MNPDNDLPQSEEIPAQEEAVDPMDFKLPTQQEGAQRMIVCEGGCE